MTKVFLGGTCNGSTWRDALIPMLRIDYFNPVVENWTPECMTEERLQRRDCDFCLYVLTPKMTGAYAVAEVVDDSNKRPKKTVFCAITDDDGETIDDHDIKVMGQVGRMIRENGGKVLTSLGEVAAYLNSHAGK